MAGSAVDKAAFVLTAVIRTSAGFTQALVDKTVASEVVRTIVQLIVITTSQVF